ncbi:NADH-quinone oxidoreductase subunit M [Rubellicoccus peritrichatus]|uniref:NADH-quinone oxidoreductase subunit M n=1 Tax=Rubellicoccus peritrichatus TaxID=3080537 RepID=A0AAQ3L8A1_9BACT|nr:NADH-quinone oxidoreductase subunit M [Puniceicoccus sp. CR14]WOO39487.1 NADH-quinone oxidoreductase subunit M [Puniceicoccus sp. CR14]
MESDLNSILLQLAIYVPLVCAIVLIFGKSLGETPIKGIAGIGFVFPAIVAIYLCFQFACATKDPSGYAFLSNFDTGLQASVGISLMLGLNGISMPLFLLAGLVGLAAGIHAIQSKAERLPLYLLLLLIMQGGLMGVFASVDIFFFYFFHELALIPTFIMVGIWGGQGRRSSAMELTIYLTLGAMLSLLGLIYLSTASDLNTYNLIELRKLVAEVPLSQVIQENIFGLLLFGFGILVSLFPFHSWAPRGYAAMPTGAAMLHSGVLKKFGLYGLIQVAAPLVPQGVAHWSELLVWLALGNIVIIGFVTISQRDLKQMIGYSSVMHMGYIFLGFATMSVIGVGGAVLLMVAHGLSVALMFMLATAVFNRTRTYDMHEIGGLGPHAPILAGFFVAASLASVGLPGFANFWGEFTVFISLWEKYAWAVAPAVLGVIISAVYGMRAIARVFFGEETEPFKKTVAEGKISDITMGERIPASILVIALVVIGIWPQSISTPINNAVTEISAFTETPTKVADTESETDKIASVQIQDEEDTTS